ncbi:HAD-IA family hydrolase [Agathobacter ruminis]|uniref:Phosphatase n=1 Tax=Agathobacter ruminis TaxID=1712665 RepID=A0A2G3E4A7_9FIRM|nr:HAD-IA family hydrolase [Agathobacter ruminis]PHU38108.1 phosphatase [Agathobacter ruminis]
MRLKDLLVYDNIIIQCHNDPDADTIGSGFALHTYLHEQGKKVALVYSGKNRIRKSNLIKMIEKLQIPIRYVETVSDCDLLITVDCQYGEGNVAFLPAKNVAIIDHHMISTELPDLAEVRSHLASCATLVWAMLREEGFDVNKHRNVATALYYGLYMDTGGLVEISHPMDRDFRDQIIYDGQLISFLRNSNLSIDELEIAGTALLRTDFMEEHRCAIVKANQCDPNILGIISDLVLEVDVVDTCVVFAQQPTGIKFSVRSCIREVMADEMAEELAKGIGSGGGHTEKAGGFIRYQLFTPEYERFCKSHGMIPRFEMDRDGKTAIPVASGCKAFLQDRIRNYFQNTSIIDASTFDANDMHFDTYKRRNIAYGYVESTRLFPVGTRVRVRSMEEDDLIITVQEQMLFLIGDHGDVNAISRSIFDADYRTVDWKFALKSSEYEPTIRVDEEGSEAISLLNCAKVCIPEREETVTAARLEKNIKLFDLWDTRAYRKGDKGDYLLMRNNSAQDLYIIEKEMFENRYQPVNNSAEKVEAVVFDLDGTLLNTIDDLADAVNAALTKVGEPNRTRKEVQSFVGNGVGLLMERSVIGGKQNPKFEAAFVAFKEYYQAHSLDKTMPYPGIMGLVHELRHRGIKMAIVSNKLDPAVKDLAQVFFKDVIDVAIGERPGVQRKPAKDTVVEALKELNVSVEHAIYVGDSEVDIQTAQNAGMSCISVSWGFKSKSFLEKQGAQAIIDMPAELLRYV